MMQAKGNRPEDLSIWFIFPAAFTVVCLLLFFPSSFLLVHIGSSPVVAYWTVPSWWLLGVIPVVVMSAHFLHLRFGANKWVATAGLCIPSLILLTIGDSYMAPALKLSQRFFSTDCTTFSEKAALQRSWDEAYDLWQKCVLDTSVAHNLTTDYLVETFRLPDCEEYEDAYEKNKKDWTYLRMLEDRYACSGWCQPAMQLWSTTPAKDSCSAAVSVVFKEIVNDHAAQVCLIMLVTLALVCVSLIFLLHTFSAQDIDLTEDF